MPDTNLAEMVWQNLNAEIEAVKARVDTIEKRTERSETASGHPSSTVALAPLAGVGAKQGDELFITDGSNLGAHSGGDGIPAFYDPDSDSWLPIGWLPRRATFWHDESSILVGSALSKLFDAASSKYSVRIFQSAGAQNEAFTQSFLMKAGTYNLFFLGETNANRGIISWYIDDVLQGTMDLYSVAQVYNVEFSIPITIATHGRHVIKGVAATQNALATGFSIIGVKYWIAPSAD